MSLKTEAIKRFLTAARSLANQGLSKEAIMQFAKNEFGEITELFQKQIDNIFKRPASGIEKIKIKDEVFDDTVVKLPYDDQLQPFNPNNPLKQYGKSKQNRPDVYSLDDYDTTNMSETKKQIIKTETRLGNLNPDSPDFKERAKVLIDEIEDLKVKLKDDKPRTDKYTGGRAGYQTGNQVTPKVDARMQNTYEQNTKLNQIQRNINERVRKGSKTQGLEIGQLGEMYGRKPTDYKLYNPKLAMNEAQKYGAATNMGLRPEQIKAVAYFNTLQKNFGDMGMMSAPLAGPGGVGPMGGGLASFTGVAPGTSPFAMEKFFKTPAERFAQYQEGLRRSMMLNPNSGIYFNPKGTYDTGEGVFGAGQSKFKSGIYDFVDPDPNERRGFIVDGKEYFSEQDAIEDMGVERYNQVMAKGGRAGYYTGGMVDVEPSLSDIGHGSDALMARTRLISPGAQGTTSTGLNYLLAEDNDNIRVPFKTGTDQSKRAFLKLLAVLGGGIASLKSGLLSFGGKGATKKLLSPIQTDNVAGKPEWFDALVTKIIKEGEWSGIDRTPCSTSEK